MATETMAKYFGAPGSKMADCRKGYRVFQAHVRERHPLTWKVREANTGPQLSRTAKGYRQDLIDSGLEIIEWWEIKQPSDERPWI